MFEPVAIVFEVLAELLPWRTAKARWTTVALIALVALVILLLTLVLQGGPQ